MAGASDHSIRLWEAATGRLVRTLAGHSDQVWSVAFSPDGKALVSGGVDKTVRLWDVGLGELKTTLPEHGNFVQAVAFSPDGRTVASASHDGTTRLWHAATDEDVRLRRDDRATCPSPTRFIGVTMQGTAPGARRFWPPRAGDQCGVASFRPTIPATISPMQARRGRSADSPRRAIPSRTVPTAPTPVHTV